jgi:hypothetical protein
LKQPGLRLQGFSSNLPRSASMLADLPSHSLTALDLDIQASTGAGDSNLSAQLARLSSLQQLRLSSGILGDSIPDSCLAGIAGLGQLTQLTLDGIWQHIVEPLKQLLEQQLPLQRLVLQF